MLFYARLSMSVLSAKRRGSNLLLEMTDIEKHIADRRLLRIDRLKIFPGDKIGLIGRNGAGKSTLLGILAGLVPPDQGRIDRRCELSYIPQLEPAGQYPSSMSGGEKTRRKIAAALGQDRPLLLADEPAANLDMSGREHLQAELLAFKGALVLVSHDRQLLDALCTVIWEIDDGALKIYRGNYSACLEQKATARRHHEREYEKYLDTRDHLTEAIRDRQARSAATRKTPKRMGNSEARLHKMGNQKAKASLDKAVKAMRARLDTLTAVEKPQDAPAATFAFGAAGDLRGKTVLRAAGLDKAFGGRIILADAAFSLPCGQRVALCGDNGCGKSTLLKMIARREAPVWVSPQARFGYFAQGTEDLDPARTVLANVMAGSAHDEGTVRRLLARLLFRRDDVFKPVGVLSGGERTRVSLARIIAGDANVLLLDEPTNYLDLPSLEALEEVLAEYRGTVLFAAHDRRFIDRVATQLLLFDSGKLRPFPGNYRQYLDHLSEQARQADEDSELVRRHRLAEILGRLSLAKDKAEAVRLESEYRALLAGKKA